VPSEENNMSTQNTKIRTSYFEGGIKLPFESPSAGDNYAASGPVTTYKLSPEELARYGPAKAAKKQTVYNFKNKYQREAEELARLDIVREKLTKQQYIALKDANTNDRDIMLKYFGKIMWDVLNKLKNEWGLVGAYPGPGKAKKKAEIKQAGKVDVGKPEPELDKSTIEHMKECYPDVFGDKEPAEIEIIPVMGSDCDDKPQETTAFDLADEFYHLQEENNDISNQIGEMVHAAEINTRRMDKIREALEGVKVAI
jgi:hypothetical protein